MNFAVVVCELFDFKIVKVGNAHARAAEIAESASDFKFGLSASGFADKLNHCPISCAENRCRITGSVLKSNICTRSSAYIFGFDVAAEFVNRVCLNGNCLREVCIIKLRIRELHDIAARSILHDNRV